MVAHDSQLFLRNMRILAGGWSQDSQLFLRIQKRVVGGLSMCWESWQVVANDSQLFLRNLRILAGEWSQDSLLFLCFPNNWRGVVSAYAGNFGWGVIPGFVAFSEKPENPV